MRSWKKMSTRYDFTFQSRLVCSGHDKKKLAPRPVFRRCYSVRVHASCRASRDNEPTLIITSSCSLIMCPHCATSFLSGRLLGAGHTGLRQRVTRSALVQSVRVSQPLKHLHLQYTLKEAGSLLKNSRGALRVHSETFHYAGYTWCVPPCPPLVYSHHA